MPKFETGKRAQALFLFLGVLVSAWASGDAEAAVWHWALALVLLAGALYPAARPLRTWIGASVACLVFWTIFHTLFVSKTYSPAGLFQPLFLLAGIAIGRRMPDASGATSALSAVSLAIFGIVGYALLTSLFFGLPARAPFETTAVLAALANLVLIPLLVYALWGTPPTLGAFLAMALLFAGLIGASSRGGWVGLSVGIALAALFFRGRAPSMRGVLLAAASLLSASGMVLLIRFAGPYLGHYLQGAGGRSWGGLAALFLAPSPGEVESTTSRLELYAVALDAARQHLPFGAGYLSFAQLLEAGRASVPSFGTDAVTFFVHNDYLQILLELGVPGFCALLAVVLVPFVVLMRQRDRLRPADALFIGACGGGLASMAFAAGVDFPFYIPVCLAVFGCLLGAIDARSAAVGIGVIEYQPGNGIVSRALASAQRVSLATGFMLLLVPLAAEQALVYANASWRQGLGQEAAYGFELARRLQPSDWRYAWYAGAFWTTQAAATRSAAAANLADESFARGFASNPLEVKNLLGRIELRRSLPTMLAKTAAPEELEAWSAQAVALAPRNSRVRLERVLVLEQNGKLGEAQGEAARFALDDPTNPAARVVAARLARRPR